MTPNPNTPGSIPRWRRILAGDIPGGAEGIMLAVALAAFPIAAVIF